MSRYKYTKEEFLKMLKTANKALLEQMEDEELKSVIEQEIDYLVECYGIEKEHYINLTPEEKVNYELGIFQSRLKKELDDTTRLKQLLTEHLTLDTLSMTNSEFAKTATAKINVEFYKRFWAYKNELEAKLRANFHPTFPNEFPTETEIRELAFRKVINEYSRLNNNLNNYNLFITILAKSLGKDVDLEEYDLETFKTNILFFLACSDYENNKTPYDTYQFPKIPIEYKTIHGVNRSGAIVDDKFTIKAESKYYGNIIRDSGSHGEYYNNDPRDSLLHRNMRIENDKLIMPKSKIRVENSNQFTRLSFSISYQELFDYVTSCLSPAIKSKYPYLISILNANKMEDVTQTITTENIKELIVIMLNNTIQYNYQHHYNDIVSYFDLTAFTFTDENESRDITQDLSNEDKAMNIKNAFGHDNISWDGDTLIIENIYRSKHIKITSNFDDLILLFLQNNIYELSTITKEDQTTYVPK